MLKVQEVRKYDLVAKIRKNVFCSRISTFDVKYVKIEYRGIAHYFVMDCFIKQWVLDRGLTLSYGKLVRTK